MSTQPTTLFLSHGGGPLPLLGDPGHREMVTTLKQIAGELSKPKAILLISAHWEATLPTITASPKPGLIYDYYGFPEESYHIQYPSPGEPQLAGKILQALRKSGIAAQMDDQRGFDHGMFVPLTILYPQADIPCVQLSLVNSMSAEQHLQIGRALRSLQHEGLLVIGSGFSFHNLPAFFSAADASSTNKNLQFEAWLIETCSAPQLSEEQRYQRLLEWHKAPYARYCHPREEHLLPLHVCYGLNSRAADQQFHPTILGKKSSFFLWR
ncbi:class III extradiol ring-cleavage dioxygenase [Halioxenophilus sp. WMMB6]|uniref:DODA-type extradiol aromatic ring-opening family dioxygenase n=1 Tax=Halioxenophilus sp. WMMB6 TaxID=3073815 RepID=UPI00295ED963|nr:class III extradiol ring-cleavage dioxygenase [Halioxenophilus sp. WMMB6]